MCFSKLLANEAACSIAAASMWPLACDDRCAAQSIRYCAETINSRCRDHSDSVMKSWAEPPRSMLMTRRRSRLPRRERRFLLAGLFLFGPIKAVKVCLRRKFRVRPSVVVAHLPAALDATFELLAARHVSKPTHGQRHRDDAAIPLCIGDAALFVL